MGPSPTISERRGTALGWGWGWIKPLRPPCDPLEALACPSGNWSPPVCVSTGERYRTPTETVSGAPPIPALCSWWSPGGCQCPAVPAFTRAPATLGTGHAPSPAPKHASAQIPQGWIYPLYQSRATTSQILTSFHPTPGFPQDTSMPRGGGKTALDLPRLCPDAQTPPLATSSPAPPGASLQAPGFSFEWKGQKDERDVKPSRRHGIYGAPPTCSRLRVKASKLPET